MWRVAFFYNEENALIIKKIRIKRKYCGGKGREKWSVFNVQCSIFQSFTPSLHHSISPQSSSMRSTLHENGNRAIVQCEAFRIPSGINYETPTLEMPKLLIGQSFQCIPGNA